MTQSNDKRPNCAELGDRIVKVLYERIKCSILTLNSERILLFAGEGTDSTHRIAFLLNQNDKKEKRALSNVAESKSLFKLAFVFVAVVLTICFRNKRRNWGGGQKQQTFDKLEWCSTSRGRLR